MSFNVICGRDKKTKLKSFPKSQSKKLNLKNITIVYLVEKIKKNVNFM